MLILDQDNEDLLVDSLKLGGRKLSEGDGVQLALNYVLLSVSLEEVASDEKQLENVLEDLLRFDRSDLLEFVVSADDSVEPVHQLLVGFPIGLVVGGVVVLLHNQFSVLQESLQFPVEIFFALEFFLG